MSKSSSAKGTSPDPPLFIKLVSGAAAPTRPNLLGPHCPHFPAALTSLSLPVAVCGAAAHATRTALPCRQRPRRQAQEKASAKFALRGGLQERMGGDEEP